MSSADVVAEFAPSAHFPERAVVLALQQTAAAGHGYAMIPLEALQGLTDELLGDGGDVEAWQVVGEVLADGERCLQDALGDADSGHGITFLCLLAADHDAPHGWADRLAGAGALRQQVDPLERIARRAMAALDPAGDPLAVVMPPA